MAEVKEVKKATAGFIVSLIGGIFNAIGALLVIGLGSVVAGFESLAGFEDVAGLAIATWGAIGLILAILVIVGAILIYMPGKEVIGGILVLVFSIICVPFTFAGLIIGLILGIVGGALGIAKK